MRAAVNGALMYEDKAMFTKSKKPITNDVFNIIRSIAARKDKDGIVGFAPGIARQILDETNWEGQRKIRQGRLQERIQWITDGTWEPTRCVITFAETPDGRLYLVDGQHRLTAIAEVGRVMPGRIDIIRARDMDHVRVIYTTFDLPDSVRSDSDALVAKGVPSRMGISTRTASAVFRALAIIRNNMEPPGARASTGHARSRSRRLNNIMDWSSEASVYQSIVADSDSWIRSKLLTAGVLAVALYTLRHCPREAAEFWSGIAANDGLRRDDPRARLIADFGSRAANSGSARQNVQRVCVAWNAFMRGRDLRVLKCSDSAPMRIIGTPLEKVAA